MELDQEGKRESVVTRIGLGTVDRLGQWRGACRWNRFRAYGPPFGEPRARGEREDDSRLTKGVFMNEGRTAVAWGSVKQMATQAARVSRRLEQKRGRRLAF